MNKRLRLVNVICTLLLLFGWTAVYSQSIDNKGKEFIMSFLPNFSGTITLELHLTSDVPNTVLVEYPVNSPTFTSTVAVTPGAITIVPIPVSASQGWTAGVVSNNSVRAVSTTDDEFVAYMINIRAFTSDAALALPVESYNTDFIALTYQSSIVSSDRSLFTVTAAFNNTSVTITPKKALVGGFPAGVPFTITLNKGEAFQARSLTFGSSGDLSGSIVESDKPITMTNGNICTNVPPGQTFCDHIFEVAQPVQTWGTSALVCNLINNPAGAVYRILASEDNTTINLDGGFLVTLNRGDFFDTGRLSGNHEFTADKPMFVAQFMTGVNPGNGDPAMGNMTPPDQYLNAYTFSTVGGGQFAQHFINVIAEAGDVGSVMLDGSPIASGLFSPIGSTGFSCATVSISQGTHTTSSPNGHGLWVYGVNNDDSYLYPGGALFNFINPHGDANPPICTITVSGSSASGVAQDDRPTEDVNGNGILDPGEDLNGNGQIDEDTGIFFITLLPGSVNLSLTVPPFTPGDGIVNFSLDLINPAISGSGVVRVTDGAGNTTDCPVNIDVVTPNNPPVCQITPPGPFVINEGDHISFVIMGSDPDAGDVVTVDLVGSLPSGATMTPSLPVSGPNTGVSSNFDWTPSAGQAGNYTVAFIVSDDQGEISNCSVDITVNSTQTDNTDPECALTGFDPGPPLSVQFSLTDNESGIKTVKVAVLSNATVEIPEGSGNFYNKGDVVTFSPPETAPILVRAAKIDNGSGASITLEVTDDAGNSVMCDPVYTTLSSITPEGFALKQNYPNPFNPTTTIHFNVASNNNWASRVSIRIYDISGREIKTLLNEDMAPGEYSIEWDGTNNMGQKVAGGMYIYRMVAGDFTATKKMVLLK